MRTEYLYEFAILARLLNFTAAAKELSISQPALSGHIASLEKELGVELIDRSRQQIALTPAGKACLPDINTILMDVDALENHAHELKRQRFLRVSIRTYEGHRYIDEVLQVMRRRLSTQHPSLEIETMNTLEGSILPFVQQGKADVALLLDTYPGLPRDLSAEPLIEDPLVAVVPQGTELAGKSVLRMCDLEGVEVLVPGLPDNHWMVDTVTTCFSEAGVHPKVSERYFNSIQDLYHTGFGGKIMLDSRHSSMSLPLFLSNSLKVLEFCDFNRMFYDVAVFRRDVANPGVRLTVEELKRVMNGFSR